jgi:hypothetical protein
MAIFFDSRVDAARRVAKALAGFRVNGLIPSILVAES